MLTFVPMRFFKLRLVDIVRRSSDAFVFHDCKLLEPSKLSLLKHGTMVPAFAPFRTNDRFDDLFRFSVAAPGRYRMSSLLSTCVLVQMSPEHVNFA